MQNSKFLTYKATNDMTLKDYVHNMGLNMGEFKRLDKETQEIWRECHKKANIRQQKEAEEAYQDFLRSVAEMEKEENTCNV